MNKYIKRFCSECNKEVEAQLVTDCWISNCETIILNYWIRCLECDYKIMDGSKEIEIL